jgi:hypothetical protein
MRTVIVGDVHGCSDELERLLSHVGFGEGDRLLLVGDLVARGPDPRGVLDLLRALGGRAVRGNHEDKLLRWRAARFRGEVTPLGPAHRETARVLRERDWELLADLPLWIDLPDHGVRVVHAGLAPGVPMERQQPRTMMFIRCLGPGGEPVEQRDGGFVPWAARYDGPPHVVFGHNAASEPQIHPYATGIDTGCVYGGRLTAMVLRAGEHPPRAPDRRDALVSVPARRAYFPK